MEKAAFDIILPVLEAAVVYASHYCKATNRNTVTAKDMEYGMKYAATTTTGKHIGTHFPEVYDSESEPDSDSDSIEDDEEPFTRYIGDEELFKNMNACFDNWDSWDPQTPAEIMIKNAIERQGNERIFS